MAAVAESKPGLKKEGGISSALTKMQKDVPNMSLMELLDAQRKFTALRETIEFAKTGEVRPLPITNIRPLAETHFISG